MQAFSTWNCGNLWTIRNRRLRPEMMDRPDLDALAHRHALAGLRRVNTWSLSSHLFWPAVRDVAATSRGEPVRILDLGCGGGDVAVSLAKRARRHGLGVQITGWDKSGLAVSMASQLAVRHQLGNVGFEQVDVLQGTLPADCDIVMCSLFLHHLSDSDAVTLLQKMAAATRQCLLVNDLRRTHFGYYLAWIGCRLLTRSSIVHHDGPASVRGAYTIGEVRRLTKMAGLDGVRLTAHWPERFLLAWSTS